MQILARQFFVYAAQCLDRNLTSAQVMFKM